MIKKPVIGVTLDSRESGEFSSYPWYAIRKAYCNSVVEAGGVPFPLTHDINLIDAYLSVIDGLIITGGRHDINPTLYGVDSIHPTVILNPTRTAFELAIAKAALERNIPVLGICGGMQVINVVLGGTLFQNIPDDIPNALCHMQKEPRHKTSHPIKISKGTLFHNILKTEKMDVNSFHHQAIQTPGKGVIVNAVSPDGVIEGIEVPAYRFCLGVQWHPEHGASPLDKEIFTSFLKAVCEQR
jgi:putative glutamine amidotransferase